MHFDRCRQLCNATRVTLCTTRETLQIRRIEELIVHRIVYGLFDSAHFDIPIYSHAKFIFYRGKFGERFINRPDLRNDAPWHLLNHSSRNNQTIQYRSIWYRLTTIIDVISIDNNYRYAEMYRYDIHIDIDISTGTANFRARFPRSKMLAIGKACTMLNSSVETRN